MTGPANYFADASAYDALMRRWSRAAGASFLAWLRPPLQARWLDVGCGTGAFTQLVLEVASPAGVMGVDASPEQVAYARTLPGGERAAFGVADAQELPFRDGEFDVVASALLINFIARPARAVDEMRRVARHGGIVAGYVWDFDGHAAPTSVLRKALREMGVALPDVPGAAATRLDTLGELFRAAGLAAVETTPLEVTLAFEHGAALMCSVAASAGPTGAALARLSPADRRELARLLARDIPTRPDGSVACSARAHAVKAIARAA